MDRLPRPDENGHYPATRAVIVAVAAGFVLFNEALFWSLAVAGRAATAGVFAHLSVGVGSVLWAGLALVLGRAAVWRWTDGLVTAATLAAAIGAPLGGGSAAGAVLGANAALALWIARGWGKKKFFRKPALPV